MTGPTAYQAINREIIPLAYHNVLNRKQISFFLISISNEQIKHLTYIKKNSNRESSCNCKYLFNVILIIINANNISTWWIISVNSTIKPTHEILKIINNYHKWNFLFKSAPKSSNRIESRNIGILQIVKKGIIMNSLFY